LITEQDSTYNGGKTSGSSDFGYIPLSISNKINQKTVILAGKHKDNKVEKTVQGQEGLVFSLNKELDQINIVSKHESK